MLSEHFWEMFKESGEIEWYLLYKEELAEEMPTEEDCGPEPAE